MDSVQVVEVAPGKLLSIYEGKPKLMAFGLGYYTKIIADLVDADTGQVLAEEIDYRIFSDKGEYNALIGMVDDVRERLKEVEEYW